jgi:hypothetical protein
MSMVRTKTPTLQHMRQSVQTTTMDASFAILRMIEHTLALRTECLTTPYRSQHSTFPRKNRVYKGSDVYMAFCKVYLQRIYCHACTSKLIRIFCLIGVDMTCPYLLQYRWRLVWLCVVKRRWFIRFSVRAAGTGGEVFEIFRLDWIVIFRRNVSNTSLIRFLKLLAVLGPMLPHSPSPSSL